MDTTLQIDSQPELEAKILSLDTLLPRVRELKKEDRTIVTTNGTFDILHAGHVLFLNASKQLGDILIVGVNSDRSVRSYKGPGRPIQSEVLRLRALSGLASVDYLFPFDEEVPMPWLEQIRPDIHTNSAEYGDDPIERETVERYGGKIRPIPLVEGVSTTRIIQRIRQGNG